MNTFSFVKKNALPITFISFTLTFLFILFNLFNGWLSLHIQTFAQSFASSFQSVVSQSTQNPDYALSHSSSTLSDIILANQAITSSFSSLMGVFALLILLVGFFVFITLYLMQHFVESYQKKKDISLKTLFSFTLIWVGVFVIYKALFFVLNLRQVLVSVITGNSSDLIFTLDRIFLFLFFYFASVSFVLLLKKKKHFFKHCFKTGMKQIKHYGLSYIVIVFILFILNFIPVQTIPLAFLMILVLSFALVCFIIHIVDENERTEAAVSLKKSGFALGSLFIVGIIIIAVSSLFTIPSLQADELAFDLPANYEQTLRLEDSQNIVLVEFVDFSCEFCKQAQPLLEQLRSFYGYDELTIVKRHYLLDQTNVDTLRAAMFYECFNQRGGGDAASNILFATDDFSVNSLLAEATLFGMDESYYASCMSSQETYDIILSDLMFAQNSGIQGTPAYILINKQTNESLSFLGAAQIEIMASIIDSWLE